MLVLELTHFPPDPRAEQIILILPDMREVVVQLLEPLPGNEDKVKRRFGIDAPKDVKIIRRAAPKREPAAR